MAPLSTHWGILVENQDMQFIILSDADVLIYGLRARTIPVFPNLYSLDAYDFTIKMTLPCVSLPSATLYRVYTNYKETSIILNQQFI